MNTNKGDQTMAENEDEGNEPENKVNIDDIEKPEEELSSDDMKDIGGGAKPEEKDAVRGSIMWA
jgi:hypothetical protein